MKLSKFLFILFIILSCNKKSEQNIENYIISINEKPINETYYIYKIDKSKNILDTIAIRKLKYDNRFLIYENNFQLKSGIETINYYDIKNGLIYSEILKNNKIRFKFITYLDNGKIDRANYITYNAEGNQDTIKMSYEYLYKKNKKKYIFIDLGNNYKTIEEFDLNENPILIYTLLENDTIEKTIFQYDLNKILKTKTVFNNIKNEKIIYNYDNKKLLKETLIKNGKIIEVIVYSLDNKGNYLMSSCSKGVDL